MKLISEMEEKPWYAEKGEGGQSKTIRRSQRDVVYRGWPIAPSHVSPNAGLGGLSQWVQMCTWSPNKLWRSNSITYENHPLQPILAYFPADPWIFHLKTTLQLFSSSVFSSWVHLWVRNTYVIKTLKACRLEFFFLFRFQLFLFITPTISRLEVINVLQTPYIGK
jgi:hypothetical protein